MKQLKLDTGISNLGMKIKILSEIIKPKLYPTLRMDVMS